MNHFKSENIGGMWVPIRRHLPFMLLFLVAATMVLHICRINPNIGGDAIRYLCPAHNLLAGKGYVFNGKPEILYSPGMGLTALVPYAFLRDIEYSGMAVSAISYLAGVVLVYVRISRMANRRLAILASAVVTMSPALVRMAHVNMADMEFVFLMLWVYFDLVECARMGLLGKGRWALTGAVIGLSALVRPDGIFFLVAAGLVILASGWFRRKSEAGARKKAAIISYLIVAGGFLLVVLPYVLFLHSHTGRWTLSMKYVMAFAGSADAVGFALNKTFLQVAGERWEAGLQTWMWILQNARNTAYSLLKTSFFVAFPLFAAWMVYPFVVSRRVQDIWREQGGWPAYALTAALFSLPVLPNLFFVVDDRILMPYWTCWHIAAAVLLGAFLSGIEEAVGRRIWPGLVLAALAGMIAGPHLPMPQVVIKLDQVTDVLARPFNANRGLRVAGFWLKAHHENPEAVRVLTRRPEILEFYLLGKREPSLRLRAPGWEWIPEEAAACIRQENLEYLVLECGYIPRMPGLMPMWEASAENLPAGFVEVYADPDGFCRIFRLSQKNEALSEPR